MLRWLTAGESHGPALMGVVEAVPAGVGTVVTPQGLLRPGLRGGQPRSSRVQHLMPPPALRSSDTSTATGT